MNQPVTSGRQIETAERRAYILELRKAGANYRTIAENVVKKFGSDMLPKGFDERYAWMDVKRELERINSERAEDTLEIRSLELERLDRLLMAMYPKATSGDYAAVDRVLKIMAQREKYITGLTVPQHIKIDSTDPLEILRQLKAENKITAADIPALLPDFGETLIKQLFGEQALVSAE